jgi:hypothetical protein
MQLFLLTGALSLLFAAQTQTIQLIPARTKEVTVLGRTEGGTWVFEVGTLNWLRVSGLLFGAAGGHW